MASNTPEIAAAHFATLPAAQQEEQLQYLADTLGRRAPVAAVEFFHSLPVEQQAAVELRETAMAYVKHDPQAASTWVASLPPTEAKDTAIGGLVDYLVKESSDPDPEAAAHWAAASLDPEGRDQRLQRVAEAWFGRDRNGARAAIEAAALPAEVKESLLRHEPVAR